MSGHDTRRDTCSLVAAFLLHMPVLWIWLLSSSVTRVWYVGCAGKVQGAIVVRWEGMRKLSVHLIAGQVNEGAESSHSCQSKVQAFPRVFQGRLYCSVINISFQRSAFLKTLQISRKDFFFHTYFIRLWAIHPTVAPTVAHQPVGMPVTKPQQGDVSQRSFFEKQNLRLVLLWNSSPGNLQKNLLLLILFYSLPTFLLRCL